MLEVDGDGALATVDGDERWANVPAGQAGEIAEVVADAGSLDFDNVGAEQLQMVGAERSGERMRQIEDTEPLKRLHGRERSAAAARRATQGVFPQGGVPLDRSIDCVIA